MSYSPSRYLHSPRLLLLRARTCPFRATFRLILACFCATQGTSDQRHTLKEKLLCRVPARSALARSAISRLRAATSSHPRLSASDFSVRTDAHQGGDWPPSEQTAPFRTGPARSALAPQAPYPGSGPRLPPTHDFPLQIFPCGHTHTKVETGHRVSRRPLFQGHF